MRGAVSLQGVRKSYGDVVPVDDVSLDVAAGEFLTLLGPSGCGKTTLLRLLAGFEAPEAGRVLISGREVTALPPHRRPVNTVFQHYALFPHRTVAGNVAFGLEMARRPGPEVQQRVGRALEMVRLTGLAERRIDQLSGGQKQRVALARAVVLEPEVLLLDEPLAALDLKLRKEMQVEVKNLQERLGTTFVFVTHDQDEALVMSDRIAVMNGGRVEQVGSPVQVFESPETEFVARFLGAVNVFTAEVRRAEDGVLRLALPDGTELAVPQTGPPRLRREPVRFVVRPEKLALRAVPLASEVSLAVIVEDRVYHGASTEWIVRDGRGERFTVFAQNAGPAGEAPSFSPGSPAFLGWDPRHCVVLRE